MTELLKLTINPKRIYGLDILRALAIIFVVLEHGRDVYPKPIPELIHYINFDGVSIFFVLSGFLIGSILINLLEKKKNETSSLLYFWIRRWARTLPAYFLILTILVVLAFIFGDDVNLWDIRSLFYFSQNLYSHSIHFFPEAWSLSIEEWFYLLVPIVLFLGVRLLKLQTKHVVFFTCIATVLIITYLRLGRFNATELVDGLNYWDVAFRKQVFMRLDSIIYGVVGAYLFYYYRMFWIKHKVFFFFFGIGILLFQRYFEYNELDNFGMYTCVFSFSVNAIGTLFLLPCLNDLKSGEGFFFRSITYISLISYSMYLINFCLVKWWIVQRAIPWDAISGNQYQLMIFKSITYWTLTIVLSIIIYKYYELPAMKLRDSAFVKRLFQRKKD